MLQITVGDKVIRNDVVALYPEEICPENMDFSQVYTVIAVHTRNTLADSIPISSIIVELEIGEVNASLLTIYRAV